MFSYIDIVRPAEKIRGYINELKSKENELIRKEREIGKMKFGALQEGIKPHFLYNALSCIAAIALENSDEKTCNAIMALGDFYRGYLSKGKNEIPLREEIEMVKSYLEIQKLRYGDIFEVEYEIDEKLLNILVPKLILQPLVENSIYHGIRLKGEKGIIKISVYKEKDRAHIVVFDTGVGMSEKQLQDIMNDEGGEKSFGLKSTIERIQYYYNDLDLYEITTKEGLYFRIDIKIPIM